MNERQAVCSQRTKRKRFFDAGCYLFWLQSKMIEDYIVVSRVAYKLLESKTNHRSSVTIGIHTHFKVFLVYREFGSTRQMYYILLRIAVVLLDPRHSHPVFKKVPNKPKSRRLLSKEGSNVSLYLWWFFFHVMIHKKTGL